MAQRKYLGLYIIFVLSIIICTCQKSLASAWLPEEGEYKFSSTLGYMDGATKKRRNERARIFTSIQHEIYLLDSISNSIKDRAKNEGRGLRASEVAELENLDKSIQELKAKAILISSFPDDKMAYFNVEYGYTNKQSFGLKIGYTIRYVF